MRDLPLAVEGAGDLREPLLMFGWEPGPPGEIAGLELFLLNRPICAAKAGGFRWVRRKEVRLGEKVVEGATHKESARAHLLERWAAGRRVQKVQSQCVCG